MNPVNSHMEVSKLLRLLGSQIDGECFNGTFFITIDILRFKKNVHNSTELRVKKVEYFTFATYNLTGGQGKLESCLVSYEFNLDIFWQKIYFDRIIG